MAGSKKRSKETDEIQAICRNKRAYHEYEVFDALECGIVLTGTEVKSLRERAASSRGVLTPRSRAANCG